MIDDTLRLERITAAAPDTPVFVDGSGRRRQRVRRLGLILLVPAAGYLALVGSSLAGGPALGVPFLPQAPARTATPTPTGPSTEAAAGADPSADPASRTAAAPSGAARPSGSRTLPAGTATTGRAPTPTATTATAAPTPTPTPTHGRPTATPGHGTTKKP